METTPNAVAVLRGGHYNSVTGELNMPSSLVVAVVAMPTEDTHQHGESFVQVSDGQHFTTVRLDHLGTNLPPPGTLLRLTSVHRFGSVIAVQG